MAEPGSLEFGEFQAVRVVNQVGAATIYAARRAADVGEPAYAVKYLQAPEFWGEEETAARLRQFIRRAVLQKRVADAAAASGEMTWAPVYGAPQSTDNGAFYVTDLYPRSAEDLCGGRRGRVEAAKLWGIVDSVVSGLRLLDRVAQRPHGNLKAGNVLLKGRGTGIRACLADPVPDDDAARAAGHAADFSALGKLVYGLVLHEACPLDSRLPAPSAAPWTALGRNGDAWRELCNRCLGAAAPFEGLDQLADAVAALRPSGKPRKAKWVVAAIVLLAAAAGGAIAREKYLQRFDFDPKKWEALCRHEWRWLETLRQSQGTLDNIPEYKSLAAGVKETDGLKSPNELAGVPQSWRPEDLAQSSKVKHDRDVGKATVDALDAIDSLRKRLDNSPPVMAIESYRREHPGAAAAEELKNVVEGARKLPDAKALGELQRNASLVAAATQAADNALRLHNMPPVDGTHRDPVMEAFAQRLTDLASGKSRLADDLAAHNTLARKMLAIDDKYDRVRFSAEVSAGIPLSQTTGIQTFEEWLQATNKYAYLEDARNPFPATMRQRLDGAANRAGDIRERATQRHMDAALKWVDSVQPQLSNLQDRARRYGDRPVLKDRDELRELAADLNAALSKLDQPLQSWLATVRQKPAEWRDQELKRFATAALPGPLLDLWQREIHRLGDHASDESLGPAIQEASQLENQLRAVCAAIAEPVLNGKPRWAEEIQKIAAGRRLRRLRALADKTAGAPAASAALKDYLPEEQASWKEWLAKAQKFIEQGDRIETLIDRQWYTPGEPDMSVLCQEWRGSDVMKDAGRVQVVVDLVELLGHLELVKSDDPAVASPDAASPALVLAAWRAADDAPLDLEAKLRTSINRRMNVLDTDRRTKLTEELSAKAKLRWLRQVRQSGGISKVIKANELRADFGIIEDDLKPADKYNCALARLIVVANDKGLSEDDARKAADEFLARESALAALAGAPVVQGKVRALRDKLQEAKKKPAVASGGDETPGPAIIGWIQEPSQVKAQPGEPERVVYRQPGKPASLTIEFAKVTVGNRETWLSTTEVPYDLFAVLFDPLKHNQSIQLIARNHSDSDPKLWQLLAGRPVVKRSWVGAPWLDKEDVPQPAPSPKLPMNAVSAQLARAWAASFGCRLPTRDEWLAAYLLEEPAGPAVGRRWNLRDKSWRDYVNGIKKRHAGDAASASLPTRKNWIAIESGELEEIDEVWNSARKGTARLADPNVYADGNLMPISSLPDLGQDGEKYGRTFYHIVGNLAELVVDDAKGGGQQPNVALVGASAFSRPGRRPDEPVPVAKLDRDRGFTDVGFRVAFPAGVNFRRVLIAFAQEPPLLVNATEK